YLVKPLRSEEIPALVERAVKRTELEKEVARLRAELGSSARLVGASRAMQDVFKQIATVALSDAPVLVTGEPGTGRELVARAIHAASRRRDDPFVVNTGRFLPAEISDAGTLFLDEIAELTDEAQARLAREEALPRLITSTSVELDRELYLRLAATEIRVPPLRERRADIPLLVAHFLEREFRYPGGMGTAAMGVLESYDWPDNVRELRNAIEAATVAARGGAIEPEHLPSAVRQVPEADDDEVSRVVTRLVEHARDGHVHDEVQGAFERALLRQVLQATDGNQVQAAKRLGIHRTTLRKLIDRYGLGGSGL
ncbi:MAG: AAA-type ATPase lid domain-containing protein, partial [Planctomycetota bacterium]